MKIYNLQSGIRKAVWEPGQAGRLSEAAQRAPFYIRKGTGKNASWVRLAAATVEEAKVEALAAPAIAAEPTGATLTKTVADYLTEVEANKAWKTYTDYRSRLENHFLKSCKKTLLADVDRKDLLAFKTYLAKESGLSPESQFNSFLSAMIFLKWAKQRDKIEFKTSEWPKHTSRKVEEYSLDEVKALLANTNAEGRLIMLCLLSSGMRNNELAHLTYGDIDIEHSVWGVNAKEGWSPKTAKGVREVPVPEWLTAELKARKDALAAKNTNYVFPTTHGINKGKVRDRGFTTDFIRAAAKKAGIQGRADCHKFRSTAATNWLRSATSMPDAMNFMGHAHADMMQRYAAALNVRDKAAHRKVTGWADQFQATS
jgi:integrase